MQELAKAFTGWQINDADPDNVTSFFTASRWFNGNKTVLGKTGNFHHRDAVDVVLAHPSHPQFLVRKLWHEFIVGEPDPATLNALTTTYVASGFQLKPLHAPDPARTRRSSSRSNEPNMIKPPVVLRRRRDPRHRAEHHHAACRRTRWPRSGQQPYFPPTVAGWEGGLSWLNTNTALARFRFANRLVNLKALVPADVPGEARGRRRANAAYAAAQQAVALATRARRYTQGLLRADGGQHAAPARRPARSCSAR